MKKKYKDVYYDVPDVKTIKELVIHGVGEGKDQPLFMYDNVNGTKDNPFITKTFNDVWHDINCLGTYMFAHGVKDCNVAIIGENSYEWIIAFFANLLGKIVSVPLDPKLPAEDLAVQLNEGECKAIFYSEYYAPTVEKIGIYRGIHQAPLYPRQRHAAVHSLRLSVSCSAHSHVNSPRSNSTGSCILLRKPSSPLKT